MPSTTPVKNLPFPLGTDRVMDGDDQIRKLAQSVENMVQTGRVTIPITAVNTTANVTWVFPVPFSASPTVIVTLIGAVVSAGANASINSISPTQTIINGFRSSGAAAFDVFVIAIGPVTPVA